MALSPHTRILRHVRFWTAIVCYILLPWSSYFLIAQATLKLKFRFPGRSGRRLERWLRIIYTSPQKVLWVSTLDFILTGTIVGIILLIIQSTLKPYISF